MVKCRNSHSHPVSGTCPDRCLGMFADETASRKKRGSGSDPGSDRHLSDRNPRESYILGIVSESVDHGADFSSFRCNIYSKTCKTAGTVWYTAGIGMGNADRRCSTYGCISSMGLSGDFWQRNIYGTCLYYSFWNYGRIFYVSDRGKDDRLCKSQPFFLCGTGGLYGINCSLDES